MKLLKLFILIVTLAVTSSVVCMEDEISRLEEQISQAKTDVRKAALRKKLEDLKAEAARRPAKVKKPAKEKPSVVKPVERPRATVESLTEEVAGLLEQVRDTADARVLRQLREALG